jgi:hypothetical protein
LVATVGAYRDAAGGIEVFAAGVNLLSDANGRHLQLEPGDRRCRLCLPDYEVVGSGRGRAWSA